jgi:magnesium-transporting ATPase (P-type)
VGIVDPPRPEAITAIAACRQAGIRVKMITGDHAGTAVAIGREMGITETDRAVTGAELEAASDEDLRTIVAEYDIFARTSPEHKLRLVQALQANGEVVSMTGDGVNDAPALKRADVGVAMGIKGTEATKEAAEVCWRTTTSPPSSAPSRRAGPSTTTSRSPSCSPSQPTPLRPW